MARSFHAPWSMSLKLITALGVVLLIVIAGLGYQMQPAEKPVVSALMISMPLLILILSLPFMILGYEVRDRALLVRRAGWASRIDLTGLQSAVADPSAMRGSLRTFGNGGLFCFAGRFWSRKLGHFRVFATDPSLAVILKFAHRTVVVTPDRPRKLVESLNGQMEAQKA